MAHPGMLKRRESKATETRRKVDEFVEGTNFDLEAVNKLIDVFHYEIDEDRSGKIEKEEFVKLMHKVGITDELVIDRNFTAWDTDGDGSIDFKEFITGLSTMERGTEDERLEMAFKVYDLDNNGKIDRDEMMTVLKRAIKLSHPDFSAGDVSVIVLDLFRAAGVDPEDEVAYITVLPPILVLFGAFVILRKCLL